MSTKKQPVVTMTGFVKDPKQQFYKQIISKQCMRLTPQLFQDTDILIVNDVCNQKYKIAKAYRPPITCVSVDWLIEINKKNKIIGTQQYQIKKIFHGAFIKIYDFPQEKSKKIQNLIKQNGGTVRIISSQLQLKQLDTKQQKTSVIIINNLSKLKSLTRQISYPIVTIQWLQQSLKHKLCKYPYDYSLNLYNIMTRQPVQHLKKMKSKLQYYILGQPNYKLQYNYMQDTYIHICDNVNKDLTKILKKLIMVLGGYYIDTICPMVTHILTQSITQIEYNDLMSNGSLIFILRVEWLIDSIYLHKKMIQTDYYIRSFKNQIINLHQRNSSAYNSISFNTIAGQFTSTMNTRKTISTVISPSVNKKVLKNIKPQKKIINGIFKSWNFYIQGNQKKQIQLVDIGIKIHTNGGSLYNSRVDIRDGHCYYVLKDSNQCSNYMQQLKKDIKNKKIQLQPVSYRWINQCISKGQYIDFYKTQSYIYKPFNFKTPIIGFHKIIFDILAIQEISKLRLKQLYNALGSVRNTPNRSQITHCLCGQRYRQTSRYNQILKQNKQVKFISYNWLIECASIGKMIDIDKYIMDKDSGGDSQNSMINNQGQFSNK